MAIYEYSCPEHGIFEVFQTNNMPLRPCPSCGHPSTKILSRIGSIKVVPNEKLPYDAWQRVDDRKKIISDPVVKKALSDYKEKTFVEMGVTK